MSARLTDLKGKNGVDGMNGKNITNRKHPLSVYRKADALKTLNLKCLL